MDNKPLGRPSLPPHIRRIINRASEQLQAGRETSDSDDQSRLLFSGNQHVSIPRLLFFDPTLEPVDRNVYASLQLASADGGGASFPSYKDLSTGCNIHRRATITRALHILRMTRWLSLCGRVRAHGKWRGNIYMLHDKPISVQEAIDLDPDYAGFVNQCTEHKNTRVNTLAHLSAGVLARELSCRKKQTNQSEQYAETSAALEQYHRDIRDSGPSQTEAVLFNGFKTKDLAEINHFDGESLGKKSNVSKILSRAKAHRVPIRNSTSSPITSEHHNLVPSHKTPSSHTELNTITNSDKTPLPSSLSQSTEFPYGTRCRVTDYKRNNDGTEIAKVVSSSNIINNTTTTTGLAKELRDRLEFPKEMNENEQIQMCLTLSEVPEGGRQAVLDSLDCKIKAVLSGKGGFDYGPMAYFKKLCQLALEGALNDAPKTKQRTAKMKQQEVIAKQHEKQKRIEVEDEIRHLDRMIDLGSDPGGELARQRERLRCGVGK